MKSRFDVTFLLRQETNVRPAKFTVLALVFTLTAFTAPLSSWAAEKTQSRFKGTQATALFDEEAGCIGTTVGVRTFDGIEREGSGKPTNGSTVDVFVEQI